MFDICTWLDKILVCNDLGKEVKSTPCALLEAHTLRVDKLDPHIALSISALLCVNKLLLIDMPSEIGILRISQRYCLAVDKDEFTEEYIGENKLKLVRKSLNLLWDKLILLVEFVIELLTLDKKLRSNAVIEKLKLLESCLLPLSLLKKREMGVAPYVFIGLLFEASNTL